MNPSHDSQGAPGFGMNAASGASRAAARCDSTGAASINQVRIVTVKQPGGCSRFAAPGSGFPGVCGAPPPSTGT